MAERLRRERNKKKVYEHEYAFYGNGRKEREGSTYIQCQVCGRVVISSNGGTKKKVILPSQLAEDIKNGYVVWGE